LASDSDREDAEEADTSATREAQGHVIAMASTILRDIARIAAGAPPVALPNHAAIGKLAGGTSRAAIGEAIRRMGLAEYQIDMNANASLTFDAIGIALGEGLSAAVAAR
jgi:hypothetical protein